MTTPTQSRKLTRLDSEQGMLVLLLVIVVLSITGVLIVGG